MSDLAPYIITAIAGIFGGGTLIALLKIRPESARISVDAAQGAVVVQSTVIASLREELTDLRQMVQELQLQMTEGETSRLNLQSENTRLKARVVKLEQQVRELGGRVDFNNGH